MKTYRKPISQVVDIQATSMLMGSINTSTENEDSFNMGGTKTGGATGGQFTRGKQGFGQGMWEDMK